MPDRAATVYTGCRVIPGDGTAPIDGAAITVRDGVIESVGTAVPGGAMERIDLTGKTVMPTIIDTHGHLGYWKSGRVASQNFSRENALDHLRRLAYYGVSALLSLGTDRNDTEIGIRDEQRAGKLSDPELALLLTAGTGIVAPTPGNGNGGPHFATDVMNEATTAEQAREAVRRVAGKRVDVVKLWIDDRRGTKAKLPSDLAEAAVREAHAHGLTAIAHIHDLSDAKIAVAAGADGLAHLVRTRAPDRAVLEAILERDVFQFSSLSIQNAHDASWLDEPALAETVPRTVIQAIREQLPTDSARQVADAYAVLEDSFRSYIDAGVRIALSGDTGARAWQIPGYAEHRELEAMVGAGMTPLAAIRAATAVPAQLLGLADRGAIAPGKRADLLVLNGDPLTDITHTRDIDRVIIGGAGLDRDLLRAQIGAGQ
ncbi:amidohydrolase family protein [Streptomyces sp. NPDC050508]|uniref:amidohydrolase family protein n=1 Tax=Streptomyces sp. NPDC050508 TaxID=3155405 RepID=UPI0034456C7C